MDLFSFPDSRNREGFWSLFPGKVSEPQVSIMAQAAVHVGLLLRCMPSLDNVPPEILHNNHLFNTFYVAVKSAQVYYVDPFSCFICRTHQYVPNCRCSSGRRVRKLYENKLPFAAHWRLPAHLLDIFNVHKPPPPFPSSDIHLNALWKRSAYCRQFQIHAFTIKEMVIYWHALTTMDIEYILADPHDTSSRPVRWLHLHCLCIPGGRSAVL